MMAWGISGQISREPIEGGIEISDEQYADALAGMLDGKVIAVVDGVLSIEEPALPEPSPGELRTACFAAIQRELSEHNNAVLSPARRQLAQIDLMRIRRKPPEECTEAETARLAEIEHAQMLFEELEHHAVLLAVEVEDLPASELAAWAPHSWPPVA